MRGPTRRQLLGAAVGTAGVAAAATLVARQTQLFASPAIAHIGYLGSDSRPGQERYAALVDGLRELGYVEGRTIAIERQQSQDPSGAVFPGMAAELLRRGVTVIVTSSTPALVAAAQATQTVPIVAAGPHRDLQDLGLVDNLARPGRNVTGLLPHPGLDTKGVELLAQTIPGLEQVGYLFNPATPGVLAQVGRARKGAEELGVEFLELPARVPDDIDAQFEAATMAGVGGLIVSTDLLFGDPSGWRVVPLALRFRLPTIYKQTDGYVDQGGLMAYTSDYKAFHRRAATFVDKLLHGANAADLPVEQTTTFDFVINLKTAEAMNLTIPRNVLVQATQLLQ